MPSCQKIPEAIAAPTSMSTTPPISELASLCPLLGGHRLQGSRTLAAALVPAQLTACYAQGSAREMCALRFECHRPVHRPARLRRPLSLSRRASCAAPCSRSRAVRPPRQAACRSRGGPLPPRPGRAELRPGRAPRRLWSRQAGPRPRRTNAPRQCGSLGAPSWPPPPGQRAPGAVVRSGRHRRVLWVGL